MQWGGIAREELGFVIRLVHSCGTKTLRKKSLNSRQPDDNCPFTVLEGVKKMGLLTALPEPRDSEPRQMRQRLTIRGFVGSQHILSRRGISSSAPGPELAGTRERSQDWTGYQNKDMGLRNHHCAQILRSEAKVSVEGLG